MHFNESQLCAIRHLRGPCLVLAGPGSGKTTVVANRIRMLTEEAAVRTENILVITFTRAAAAEMQSRFRSLADSAGGSPVFGTFHSVFYKMIRTRYGLNDRSILTETEKRGLVRETLFETDAGGEDADFVTSVLSEISRMKNSAEKPSDSPFERFRIDIKSVFQSYEKKKKKLNKIDFDDMLTLCLNMLKTEPGTLKYWQEKFQYILVDEFQDINPVQFEIVRMIALPENNLFAVGDDDQSVYRFRGADPSIMLRFPEIYRNARIIPLHVNYRSVRSVTEAAEKLIARNKKRYPKKIRAVQAGEGAVFTEKFRNAAGEYEKTAALIQDYREKGTPYEKMAVLSRTNSGTASLAGVLTEKKIPFIAKERIPNVFRHPVCAPVYAVLNWTAGNRTRGNFLKFMNCPVRFIRRSDLKSEVIDLEELQRFYAADRDRSWMADRMGFFMYQLELLKKLGSPFAMINYFRKGMEYDDSLIGQAEEKHTDPKALLGVLDELQESAEPFETTEDWYAHIAGVTRELDRQTREGKNAEAGQVVLSTLHGAKGLEFDVVFILDVNEKVIPHEKAEKAEDLEEERRLFYVGMTRAAKKLHLFSVAERFGKEMEPSRFLKEIGHS